MMGGCSRSFAFHPVSTQWCCLQSYSIVEPIVYYCFCKTVYYCFWKSERFGKSSSDPAGQRAVVPQAR